MLVDLLVLSFFAGRPPPTWSRDRPPPFQNLLRLDPRLIASARVSFALLPSSSSFASPFLGLRLRPHNRILSNLHSLRLSLGLVLSFPSFQLRIEVQRFRLTPASMSHLEGSKDPQSCSVLVRLGLCTEEQTAVLDRKDVTTEVKLRLVNGMSEGAQYATLCEKYEIQLPYVVVYARVIDGVRDKIITFAYTNLLTPLDLVESVLNVDPTNPQCWFSTGQSPSYRSAIASPRQLRLEKDTEPERESLFW